MISSNFGIDIKPEYCVVCEDNTMHKRKIRGNKVLWVECGVCKNMVKSPVMMFHILRNRYIYVPENELPIIQA